MADTHALIRTSDNAVLEFADASEQRNFPPVLLPEKDLHWVVYEEIRPDFDPTTHAQVGPKEVLTKTKLTRTWVNKEKILIDPAFDPETQIKLPPSIRETDTQIITEATIRNMTATEISQLRDRIAADLANRPMTPILFELMNQIRTLNKLTVYTKSEFKQWIRSTLDV